MKLFKNFKTKKQLRKELEALSKLATIPDLVKVEDRRVQKLGVEAIVEGMPGKHEKQACIRMLSNAIGPYIEWKIVKADGPLFALQGTIRVIDEKQKSEGEIIFEETHN